MSTGLMIFLALFFGFWIVILVLEKYGYTKKIGVEREAFIVNWKTQRFINFLDRGGKKYRRFWRFYGNFGIVLGIFMMVNVFALLVLQAYFSLTDPDMGGGVVLVIPGVTIPLWYGLFALLIVLIVHEFSHGFLARAQDLKVKSVGLLLFAIIPGAFVEPDEDELKETKRRKRMRVYSVGSLANLITGFISLCFLAFLLSYTAQPTGVYIAGSENETVESIPDGGEILYSINDGTVRNLDEVDKKIDSNLTNYTIDTSDGIYNYTGYATRDGRNLTIHSENTTVTFILSDMSNSLFADVLMPIRPIYFYKEPYYDEKDGVPSFIWIIIQQLAWIALLNMGIGLINLLPMIPLDGGALFKDIMQKITNDELGAKIAIFMSFVSLFVILLNIIPAFTGGMTSLK